jgi:outer membrane protein TolC
MRWNALVFTVVMALATMTGCAQQNWLTEKDYNDFHARNALPAGLEANTSISSRPTSTELVPKPATVDFPEREPRYISLAECIAITLENGTTGIQSVRQPGAINEDLLTVAANGGPFQVIGTDSLRVLSLSPAASGTVIDAALARFDAKWITTLSSGTVDQPVQGFNSFTNGDQGRFATSIIKGLATGGAAAVTFNTLYQDLTQPPNNFPLRNPAYSPRVQFTFEQPLWQSSGIGINELLSRNPQILGTDVSKVHPEALSYYNGHLINVQNGANNPLNPSGILVARTRFDQSRAELERVINFALYNVEVAYWNLYGSYVNLYSTEQALRFGYETWKIARAKFQSGLEGYTQERLAQSRGQFEQFRGDRLQAIGRVLEAERVLRVLMGLKVEDCKRLVPVDSPTLAPFAPCWEAAWEETLVQRPELVVARAELRALQYDLMVQQNFLKPDVRLLANYGVNGLGSRIDGDGQFFDQSTGTFRPSNAFRQLASDRYSDWNVALTANIPIGFRFEHAAVRRAKLLLAQGYLAVKREENKAEFYLMKTYRDIFENYRVMNARRSQREAYGEQLRARLEKFRAGSKEATIEFVLQAQQQWSQALTAEYQAIVTYNNALAAFQFAKGSIMQHDNVHLSEGAIPECAQTRAVEHERERSHALLLRERANLVPHAAPNGDHDVPYMPHLPNTDVPSVPALMDNNLPVPDKLEEGPAPKQLPPSVGWKASEPMPTFAGSSDATRVSAPAMPAVPTLPPASGSEVPALPGLPLPEISRPAARPTSQAPMALPPAPAVSRREGDWLPVP